MIETPNLRWFESTERKCAACGKRATGILRGIQNESYGPHCEPCANKRLRASEKARRIDIPAPPATADRGR